MFLSNAIFILCLFFCKDIAFRLLSAKFLKYIYSHILRYFITTISIVFCTRIDLNDFRDFCNFCKFFPQLFQWFMRMFTQRRRIWSKRCLCLLKPHCPHPHVRKIKITYVLSAKCFERWLILRLPPLSWPCL